MLREYDYPLSVRMGSDRTEQVIMTLVFAVLLKPAWIGTIDALSKLWMLAQLGVFAVLMMTVTVNKLGRCSVLMLIMAALMGASTLLNKQSIWPIINDVIPYTAMVLACDLWMRGGRGKQMLRALERLLTIYVYINFATVVLLPGGLYTSITSDGVSYVKCWFLGYKNPQIRTLLPALMVTATNKWYGRHRIISMKFVLMALIVFATVVLVDSATSMLVVAAFLGLMVMLSSRKAWMVRLLNAKTALFVLLMGTALVVLIRQFGGLATILSLIFPNRDIGTLTHRTVVWDAAVELIYDNWLLGRGNTAFISAGGWGVSHPHNLILYHWMSGGVGAVLVSLMLFYSAMNHLYGQRSRFVSKVYLAAIMMFLVMGIVESPTEFPLMYAMLAIGFNLDRLGEGMIDIPERRSVQAGEWTLLW